MEKRQLFWMPRTVGSSLKEISITMLCKTTCNYRQLLIKWLTEILASSKIGKKPSKIVLLQEPKCWTTMNGWSIWLNHAVLKFQKTKSNLEWNWLAQMCWCIFTNVVLGTVATQPAGSKSYFCLNCRVSLLSRLKDLIPSFSTAILKG